MWPFNPCRATKGTIISSKKIFFAATLILASAGYHLNAEPAELPTTAPTVVLLHGLARSSSSMRNMEAALQEAGYRVCNISYPSRQHPIADLAANHVAPSIAQCEPDPDKPISFVTHSLGGIVVRQLASAGLVRTFGRVVMLGPPNHGSEVVDALGDWYLFEKINGPAGNELGTSADSVPLRLGPATFETGIIAGQRSINWINSLIIPGVDDGKVSIESARLEGMRDFLLTPVSHPFLMKDREVIAQTIQFLNTGCFARERQNAESPTASLLPCVTR